MYTLDYRISSYSPNVAVVGCGGTGSFVAEGLCRLLPEKAPIFLIDMDRVEERNLARSLYTADDLGKFKSEALACRLSGAYQRPIKYSTLPVSFVGDLREYLVIGCVDNGLARRDIAEILTRYWARGRWWIDSGNDHNYGQVLIGNTSKIHEMEGSFHDTVCWHLPLPTIQSPDLLQERPRLRSCDEAVDAGDQGPTINQAMASLVLEVVRRLIEGSCHWMQLYLDLDVGSLTPVMATPEVVSRITGISVRKLTKKGGER